MQPLIVLSGSQSARLGVNYISEWVLEGKPDPSAFKRNGMANQNTIYIQNAGRPATDRLKAAYYIP